MDGRKGGEALKKWVPVSQPRHACTQSVKEERQPELAKEKERKKGRKEGRKEGRKKERKKERKKGKKKERKKDQRNRGNPCLACLTTQSR